MKVQILTEVSVNETIVRFVLQSESGDVVSGVGRKEFSAAVGAVCRVRAGKGLQVYAGIGKSTVDPALRARAYRRAAGESARNLLGIGIGAFGFDLRADFLPGASGEPPVEAIVEGALLGAYTFETLKTKDRRDVDLEKLILIVPEEKVDLVKKRAKKARLLAEAVNRVREIGNQPGNLMPPARLAREADGLAEKLGITCRIRDEKALRKEGFGGLLAVGMGSAQPPRFIHLSVVGKGDGLPTVAVVGKAITFDTGGIDLKPAAGMEEMVWDKMGGVAVLGIVESVARLGLPLNLEAFICAAENMPGPSAYRPGDVVTTYSGQTVEILNTDAEGRMVLADGLAYAVRHHQPDLIIDLATLTGACVVALGEQRSGCFSNESALANDFFAIGELIDDRCWPLPMGGEYRERMKSRVADLRHIGPDRWGGASDAASFLAAFVGDIPYVHLDIAGPAASTKARNGLEAGATGAGVRLVVEFLKKYGETQRPIQTR